jgi:hypothetical protein
MFPHHNKRAINIALLAEWGVSVISFLVAQKIVRRTKS